MIFEDGVGTELMIQKAIDYIVRLRRVSSTTVEGVFTCDIPGGDTTPRGQGMYYPCEL